MKGGVRVIEFIRDKGLFHLHNDKVSWVLMLRDDELGMPELLHLYVGKPLDNAQSAVMLQTNEGASFDSLRQILPYACPTQGRGDYRPAMVSVRDKTGQSISELFYTGHFISKGKPALPGLPATYTENDEEAITLKITLKDPLSGLRADVSYTLFENEPAMAISAVYTNEGDEALTLERAMSAALTLRGSYSMLHLAGGWGNERQVNVLESSPLTRTISSSRGASGHEHNPFAAFFKPGTDETSGECLGVSLVYSGDFEISADKNAYGTTRIVAGLNPDTFSWRLDSGDSFQTPECVIVFGDAGLNSMSAVYHRLYRSRLCRGYWRDRERPILINNWEATYFNFDHKKLLKIAKCAARAGIELFVLDDGWFGKRNDDTGYLGDWTPDTDKLPQGLGRLSEEINALGMMFGLWFEPEMVSPNSELYRAHPDWCLHVPGRRRTPARNQLILDMSRRDVQDYIIDAVGTVLSSAHINYVKWDMNRNFKEAGSDELLGGGEGELHHRYMLGVYRVMESLTKAFPEVLFEGCSGGGGRFDPGMLYYMPQIWTSDDSDAVERLKIQYGTSMCYPASAMGAHVSASPNHQVSRITPLATRADVALGGNFGYELDLTKLSEGELNEIARQVERQKQLRRTTLRGEFTRLLSPFRGNVTAWMFADTERLILCCYRVLARPNAAPFVIRLKNVPAGMYKLEDGRLMSANDLMNAGLIIDFPHGDFASRVMVLEREAAL
ncbi:MAG: alpha-galactosidase [Clostridia bacterium]|nr:alpha-galactosidase [Clostridia bacterium]